MDAEIWIVVIWAVNIRVLAACRAPGERGEVSCCLHTSVPACARGPCAGPSLQAIKFRAGPVHAPAEPAASGRGLSGATAPPALPEHSVHPGCPPSSGHTHEWHSPHVPPSSEHSWSPSHFLPISGSVLQHCRGNSADAVVRHISCLRRWRLWSRQACMTGSPPGVHLVWEARPLAPVSSSRCRYCRTVCRLWMCLSRYSMCLQTDSTSRKAC